MTKSYPVLLNEDLEAFKGTIVRVEHYLSKSTELSGSIPAIGAVHDDIVLLDCDSLQDLVRTG